MEPTIIDDQATQRYEARLGDDLAGFLDYYIVGPDRIALIHTEVLPAYRGQGIGEALAKFALDDARGRELHVIVTCRYVRAYVDRHPETHNIIAGWTPA